MNIIYNTNLPYREIKTGIIFICEIENYIRNIIFNVKGLGDKTPEGVEKIHELEIKIFPTVIERI
jgi:hypothetical protein